MESVVDLTKRCELLRKQPVFAKLHDAEIIELAEILQEIHFNAGDVIVKEGDHVDSVFIIVKGEAEVNRTNYDINPHPIEHVANLGPSESIGLNETGFYSMSGMRSATVIAKTSIDLLRLSVAAFHGFSLANTHVSRVMRETAKRFLSE